MSRFNNNNNDDDADEFWKNSEDFWNTSSSSTFNFEDDQIDEISNLTENIIIGTTDCGLFEHTRDDDTNLQITSIISKECLALVTDDVRLCSTYVTPPVEETIKKMFYGYQTVLEIYRTLDDKLALLDVAIDYLDGDIIITVILFLKRTLKANIFYNSLSKRRLAIKHYANYLIMKDNFNELADLYMATGNTSNLKDIYFLICKDGCRQESLYRKLEQFLVEHSINLNNSDDIREHLSFIKWQIDNNQNCESIIDQLANLSMNKYDKNIIEFKNRFKIDDYQYEWTIMNVLARLELWPTILDTFIRNNWLTKKYVLNSVIRPEVFTTGLSRHKPPKTVFEQFLQCINDTELCLALAKKLEIHKFLINYYINQKDRISLLEYRNKSNLNVEESALINRALEATDKKWKN